MSDTSASSGQMSGEQPFELHYFPPDPDLADMVSSFYCARINMPRFDEYERADRPQFRFITVADGEYVFSDGHSSTVRRANIVGPTSGRVRAISNSPTRIFGFGMLPAGWAALMGSHGEKLTDRAIDAADLFGDWINEVADALRPCLGSIIAITGHTDKAGTEPGNLALSMERARMVRQALIERGIPRDGLRASGVGSSQPVEGLAPSDPANRRIEFSVIRTEPLRPTPVDTPGAR